MTVFIPRNRKAAGIYYVYFRYWRDGRKEQFFQSTREKDRELALKRGAEMFAAEIRRPDDTRVETKIDNLSEQLAELRVRLDGVQPSPVPSDQVSTQIRSPLVSLKPKKLISEALLEFFEFKAGAKLRPHSLNTLRIRNTNFAAFCEKTGVLYVQDIKEETCLDWIASTKAQSSLRAYLGDVGNFLTWCTKHPRKWLKESPVSKIDKGRKKRKPPVILQGGRPREILKGIEKEFPEYRSFYAIALLTGARQDKEDGEIKRLAQHVAKNGWKPYLTDTDLIIPVPKVGEDPRRFPAPPNLREWILANPTLKTPSAYMHGKVIKRFHLPPNSMRHTAISAFVCSTGNLGVATMIFNTSTVMMQRHYFSRMTREEWEDLYSIRPSLPANVSPSAPALLKTG